MSNEEAKPIEDRETIFRKKLTEFPSVYFDYAIENIQFAHQARYEMKRLFIYPNREGDTSSFFRALYEFLSFAANVSRVFWDVGIGKERQLGSIRTAVLREIVGLTDEHPLSKRDWRNHIAHYESRIDNWLLNSQRMNIARRIIGPIGQTVSGLDEHEIFEQYDPANHTFYFRGTRYSVNEIHNDLNEIAALVQRAVQRNMKQ
jgi:hypothetical protein